MKKGSLSADRFVGQMPKMEVQIKASKWYGENEEALRKKYGGKFIAIQGKEIKSSTSTEKLVRNCLIHPNGS